MSDVVLINKCDKLFSSAWTSRNYGNDTALSKFKIKQALGNGLGVAVESMGLISYQRAYRQVLPSVNGTTQGVTYPLMMAVINVVHGKVTVSAAFLALIC